MGEKLNGDERREHVKRESWRRNWLAVEQFVRDTNERLAAQSTALQQLDMRLTATITRMQTLEALVQQAKVQGFGPGPSARK